VLWRLPGLRARPYDYLIRERVTQRDALLAPTSCNQRAARRADGMVFVEQERPAARGFSAAGI